MKEWEKARWLNRLGEIAKGLRRPLTPDDARDLQDILRQCWYPKKHRIKDTRFARRVDRVQWGIASFALNREIAKLTREGVRAPVTKARANVARELGFHSAGALRMFLHRKSQQ
jgi:hypothetical protein